MSKLYAFTFSLIIMCSFTFTLQAQCPTGEVEVSIVIEADTWAASETDWTLTDTNGNQLASGSPDGQNVCVDPNLCLLFTITDTGGDGLAGDGLFLFEGSFTVYYDGIEISTGVNFGFEHSVYMGNCQDGVSCDFPLIAMEGVSYDASSPNEWYTFVPSASGLYQFSTCFSNDLFCETQVYLYDYCTNLDWQDNQQGTIAYANSGCGLLDNLADLNTSLSAGSTIYVRIASQACGGQISWQINYLGGITGCMDTNACNFNPSATISDPASCAYPPDPECMDGPDLMIDEQAIINTIQYEELNTSDECYVQEGCLSGYGTREILRFTTTIANIGTQDYYIGSTPLSQTSDDPQWEWDECHQHWHYEGYASYTLFDQAGTEIPVGFKNGFCVLDLSCNGGGFAKYNCQNQGITAGCEDTYDSYLACQWLDITDVADGVYSLVVKVNWDESPDALGRQELSYANNAASVCVEIDRSTNGVLSFSQVCNPVLDCEGTPYGNAQQDCNGVCNGPDHAGDLDGDHLYTELDIETYINELLDPYITPSTCTDVDVDGSIDLGDAVLVAACKVFNEQNSGSTDHVHCDLPRPEIQNYAQQVHFSIGYHDPVAQYVDIYVQSGTARLLAYQLEISGIMISNVEAILAEPGYDMMYGFNGAGMIVGVSPTETFVDLYNLPEPLFRVHYSSLTADDICIESVPAALNHAREQIATSYGDCISVSGARLHVRALLEGPYIEDYDVMVTGYLNYNLLPTQQPFNQYPWFYTGNEEVLSPLMLPDFAVDWVLVELWDANGPIERKAALMLQEGVIVDTDGIEDGVDFASQSASSSNFVVIRARNHLDVRSDEKIPMGNSTEPYDFTLGNVSAGAGNMKQLDTGEYALAAGDFDGNGVINFSDYNLYLLYASGLVDYAAQDLNMDAHVTVQDFNLYKSNSDLMTSPDLWY